jgi:hypothetical protein
VQIDNKYVNILCSEESVCVSEQEKSPNIVISENFSYVPIEKKIDWLAFCKIKSINFLVDKYNVKRGILFFLDNNHNFAYYNKGYEFGDKNVFEIDMDIYSIGLSYIAK